MMKTVTEIIVEVLLEETPLAEGKCKQIAEKITKKLGMEKVKIINLDTISNNSFAIGKVEEEQ